MKWEIDKGDVDRFNAKVAGGAGCWEWQAGRSRRGYGMFRVGRKLKNNLATVGAHRFAWIMAHGDAPEGLCVCHKCDNPGCVRPSHLFLGTHKDNARDCISKGRKNCRSGSDHWAAKLSEKDVASIRLRCSLGELQKTLAMEYGVSRATVCLIVNRKHWRKSDDLGA